MVTELMELAGRGTMTIIVDVIAIRPDTVVMNEILRTISPQAAFSFLNNHRHALLIDVRSQLEFLFVGHPTNAINIPWIDEPDWEINIDFTRQVRQATLANANGKALILLICRSGVRSLEAGKILIEAGIADIYNIQDGFEGPLDNNHQRSSIAGWRFHGLPWEQC